MFDIFINLFYKNIIHNKLDCMLEEIIVIYNNYQIIIKKTNLSKLFYLKEIELNEIFLQ